MINRLHKNAGNAYPAIPGYFWVSNNPRKIEPPWAVEKGDYYALYNDIGWKDIEVINDENGRPYANLLNIEIPEIEEMDISISHCKEYATANVVVVWK